MPDDCTLGSTEDRFLEWDIPRGLREARLSGPVRTESGSGADSDIMIPWAFVGVRFEVQLQRYYVNTLSAMGHGEAQTNSMAAAHEVFKMLLLAFTHERT